MNKIALLFISVMVVILAGCQIQGQEKAIDRQDMDTTVKPGENFYQYANGGWLENNPIPKEKSRYGSFDQLADKGKEQVRELVKKTADKEHEQGTVAQQIGDFYASGMNVEQRNKYGLEPIEDDLKRIDAISSKDELIDEISRMHKYGIRPLFNLYGSADAKNSEMVVTHLSQGGLGMPNRDYYTSDDERTEKIRQKYVEHVSEIFQLAGKQPQKAEELANLIMKLETRLAKHSMTLLERRDPHKRYNKMDLAGVKEISPNFKWQQYFENMGLGDPGVIIVGQPEFFKEISVMMDEVSLGQWKNYLSWQFLNGAANYLSDDFVQQDFAFYGKVLSGKEENKPRWKRVLNSTNRALSKAIGKLYVEKYFPQEAKTRMLDLVSKLKKSLGERINDLDWMTDSTKIKALEKLQTMNVKIGYPDKWRDYSGLEVKDQHFVKNVLEARKFNKVYQLNKINKPVDEDEWHMPPQMVNAYYSPSMNEIVFPAAILQPPFFYMDADDAVNYGAIGVVIGHEMTHGFDDQGRQYDKDGNLKDWWTKKDAKRFDKRAQVLVDQYNKYTVLDTMKADGELTLGENIADLGGLNIAYQAFKKTKQGKKSEKINGFTPDQRFFLAFAHIWAQNIRDEEIVKRTREDVHSLGRLRVIGPLRNMPEFHEAFDIEKEQYMHLPEKQRAMIW